MKILFDQNTPRTLAKYLVGHTVTRAAQLRWEELPDGDLLKVAEMRGFELFITGDQNLSYQQNLARHRIAILVLSTNNWPLIEAPVAEVLDAVRKAVPGSHQQVTCGRFSRRRLR